MNKIGKLSNILSNLSNLLNKMTEIKKWIKLIDPNNSTNICAVGIKLKISNGLIFP